MLCSIIFNCLLSSGSKPGWKQRLKISSTTQRVITARPTAVISCLPVLIASMLTKGTSHDGNVTQSFRMLNERLVIAPFRRLKRVVYSLSSSDVRLWDMRWLAIAFCSCSTCPVSCSISFLPSKYSLLTFLYFVTVAAMGVLARIAGELVQ